MIKVRNDGDRDRMLFGLHFARGEVVVLPDSLDPVKIDYLCRQFIKVTAPAAAVIRPQPQPQLQPQPEHQPEPEPEPEPPPQVFRGRGVLRGRGARGK